MTLRTCVTFTSNAFNVSISKPEFVHPENFGDDVARWFMTKFHDRQIGFDEEDPSQEDHGWYVTFRLNGLLYDLVASYAPTNDAQRWLLSLERSVGLLRSMMGQRRRGVTIEAVQLINDILQASAECQDVKWLFFSDVRRGNLQNGSDDPLAG